MSKMHSLPMTHVKPHGALNNMACEDRAMAEVIVSAVKSYNSDLIFLAPVLSKLADAAKDASFCVALEVFADRAYTDTGSLVSRQKSGAVIDTAEGCINQVLAMIEAGGVITETGATLTTEFHSICVHGDNAHAVETARLIRDALLSQGHVLLPLPELMTNS
jgi:UPF0271 protein